MFPGDDPQVLLYMAIKSENCATANVEAFVKSMVKNTSKYLGIYDEAKVNVSKLDDIVVTSYINKDVKSIQSYLKANQIDAVILGNEVKGVHQEVIDVSDGCLEIPQFGTKHSMNVSVTAGIIIWHFAQIIINK